MKVVSKSEAARMAGVRRQAINDLKNINNYHKGRYPFFVFDPGTGKPGVNIDHKEWINYLDRNQSIRVKKNKPKQNTGSKVIGGETGNNASAETKIKEFVLLCMTVAQKYMSQKKYTEFKNELTVEYKRVNK